MCSQEALPSCSSSKCGWKSLQGSWSWKPLTGAVSGWFIIRKWNHFHCRFFFSPLSQLYIECTSLSWPEDQNHSRNEQNASSLLSLGLPSACGPGQWSLLIAWCHWVSRQSRKQVFSGFGSSCVHLPWDPLDFCRLPFTPLPGASSLWLWSYTQGSTVHACFLVAPTLMCGHGCTMWWANMVHVPTCSDP